MSDDSRMGSLGIRDGVKHFRDDLFEGWVFDCDVVDGVGIEDFSECFGDLWTWNA